jgi:hypothetical protein
VQRDGDSFELDDDFGGDSDQPDFDRFIDRGDRRAKVAAKRGRAAWSQLEDVLAEKRLRRQLQDYDYDET